MKDKIVSFELQGQYASLTKEHNKYILRIEHGSFKAHLTFDTIDEGLELYRDLVASLSK